MHLGEWICKHVWAVPFFSAAALIGGLIIPMIEPAWAVPFAVGGAVAILVLVYLPHRYLWAELQELQRRFPGLRKAAEAQERQMSGLSWLYLGAAIVWAVAFVLAVARMPQ